MTKIIFILILSISFNVFSKDPKVKFILNDDYIIFHSLIKGSGGLYKETVTNLQNKAYQIDSFSYKKLMEWKYSGPIKVQSTEFQTEFSKFFSLLKKTEEFSVFKSQTLDYLKKSKKEWNRNLRKTTVFMEKYSGFKFGAEVNLYITHPASRNGRAWKSEENKVISFGTWPEFDNYLTVYVWHEILHMYMSSDDISHAVNQMLTDVDLQNYLNPQLVVEYTGHPCLKDFTVKNQKVWNLYKEVPTNLNEFSNYLTQQNNGNNKFCDWW